MFGLFPLIMALLRNKRNKQSPNTCEVKEIKPIEKSTPNNYTIYCEDTFDKLVDFSLAKEEILMLINKRIELCKVNIDYYQLLTPQDMRLKHKEFSEVSNIVWNTINFDTWFEYNFSCMNKVKGIIDYLELEAWRYSRLKDGEVVKLDVVKLRKLFLHSFPFTEEYPSVNVLKSLKS